MTKKTRTIIALVLFVAFAASATAQEKNATQGNALGNCGAHFDESAPQRIMPTRYGGRLHKLLEAKETPSGVQPASEDSLHLPALSSTTASPINNYSPYGWGGRYNNWALHQGLNVQVGASVFAEFGKGAHSGTGFQENIALMYAMPITDKWSVAIGGYLNNINYAGNNWHDAGVSAVIGYQFNEHWEAYIYGQKSITNNLAGRLRYGLYDGYYGGYGMGGYGMQRFSRNAFGISPYSIYDIGNFGDRIGATLRYNFNPSFSVEVSVEQRWMPSR